MRYAHLAPGRNRFRRESIFEMTSVKEMLEMETVKAVITEIPLKKDKEVRRGG